VRGHRVFVDGPRASEALAERFLAAYARASGDYELYELVDFYEGYRAYVRGKVSSMLAEDRSAKIETREQARTDARSFFLLSLLEGREALVRPAVVAVGGVIASGKSTIADRVGASMNAPVVDSDRARKELAGVSATTPMHEASWTGAYAPEFTARVYDEVFRRAASVLTSGRAVVLDASFRSRAHRDRARALGREHNVPFYFVECRAHPDECKKRLERRARSASVSDGRSEISGEFLASFEPPEEIPEGEHLVVDTALPTDENVRRLANELPTWPEGFNG
jgi:predicted kinase